MTLFCKGRNGAEERESSCLGVAKWKPAAATFLMHVVHASSFMFLFLHGMAKGSTESLQALPGFRDAACPQGKQ